MNHDDRKQPVWFAARINEGVASLQKGDVPKAHATLLDALVSMKMFLGMFPPGQQMSMSTQGNDEDQNEGSEGSEGITVIGLRVSSSQPSSRSTSTSTSTSTSKAQQSNLSKHLYTCAQTIAISSVQHLEWNAAVVNSLSSTLIYNIALLHHFKTVAHLATNTGNAMSNRGQYLLMQIKKLYRDAYQLAANSSRPERHRNVLFMLGIWNNLAHVHRCLGDHLAATLCCQQILQVLSLVQNQPGGTLSPLPVLAIPPTFDQAETMSMSMTSSSSTTTGTTTATSVSTSNEFLRSILTNNMDDVRHFLESAIEFSGVGFDTVAPAA